MDSLFKMTLMSLLVQQLPVERAVRGVVKRRPYAVSLKRKAIELGKTLFWIAISIVAAVLLGRFG